ncbi:MAG: CYTH domain-containing protein [Firmicutes bacterium]|nr:CYTH domain-containing protein [Bacillota bacterium]
MKNKELEIKFALRDPKQGHVVFSDPWIRALTAPDSERSLPMRAVYYDDPGRHLAAHRIGYRVRREGEEYISTLKWSAEKETAGFSRRLEYNLPAKGEDPDLTAFLPLLRKEPFPEAGQLGYALQSCGNLRPLFISDCRRQLAEIRFRESRIELSCDTGELQAGDRQETVCELECELKEGREEDLKAFGEELQKRFGLSPLNDSKLKRGLKLAQK